MNKDTENKSRSLEIQTKKIFGEYLNDVNINEICFNGDGSIWTQDFKSIWTEHKRDISYDEMMAFAVPVASHKEDTLKGSKPILSASLNVFTKSKYEDKECTKAICTFKNLNNELIDLVTLSNIYKNGWILKPIIIDCFIKAARPYENSIIVEVIQSKQLIFEILDK